MDNDAIIKERLNDFVENLSNQIGQSRDDTIALISKTLPKLKLKKVEHVNTLSSSKSVGRSIGAKSTGIIKLHFIKGEFVHKPKSTSESQATVEVKIDDSIVLLSFFPETSLIARRTASRQAESIAKSGFVLPSNERIGVGFKFEIDEGEGKLSEAHTRVGHEYNRL